jgi:hypothetical protein
MSDNDKLNSAGQMMKKSRDPQLAVLDDIFSELQTISDLLRELIDQGGQG